MDRHILFSKFFQIFPTLMKQQMLWIRICTLLMQVAELPISKADLLARYFWNAKQYVHFLHMHRSCGLWIVLVLVDGLISICMNNSYCCLILIYFLCEYYHYCDGKYREDLPEFMNWQIWPLDKSMLVKSSESHVPTIHTTRIKYTLALHQLLPFF